MRADLLPAQASLDWAISNFPALQQRLRLWTKNNISLVRRQTDADATHDIMVALEKEPLPLSFTAEVGAYINAIRASLDILAVAIAERHGIGDLDGIYFPVAASKEKWLFRDFKGAKLVKDVPDATRKLIEACEPYKGGNDNLYALHKFDILRKHMRLLSVIHQPAAFSISGWHKRDDIIFPRLNDGAFMDAGNGETVICMVPKWLTQPKMHYTPEIFFSETDPPFRMPVIAGMTVFAATADAAIKMFDTP